MGEIDLDRVELQLTQYLPASSRSNGPDFLRETSLTLTHAESPGLRDEFGDGHMVQSEPMSHKPGPSVGRKGHSLFSLELNFVVFSLEP